MNEYLVFFTIGVFFGQVFYDVGMALITNACLLSLILYLELVSEGEGT
jgi:hypothetical protein